MSFGRIGRAGALESAEPDPLSQDHGTEIDPEFARTSSKRNRGARRTKVALGTLLAIVCAVALVDKVFDTLLEREKDLAEREGLVVRLSSLRTFKDVPPYENAAELATVANRLQSEISQTYPVGPNHERSVDAQSATVAVLEGSVAEFQPGPSPQHPKVIVQPHFVWLSRVLRLQAKSLQLYRSASLKPHLAFEKSFRRWPIVDASEEESLGEGISLLELDGAFALSRGDPSAFFEDWSAAARLIHLLGEEVGPAPLLDREPLLIYFYELTGFLLSRFPRDEGLCTGLSSCLDLAGPPKPLLDSMRIGGLNATCMHLAAEGVRAGDPEFTTRFAPEDFEYLAYFSAPILRPIAERHILQNIRRQFEVAKKDGDDLLLASKDLEAATPKHGHEPFWGSTLTYFSPGYRSTARLAGLRLARYRMVRQTLAAIALRARTGQWPSVLPLKGSDAIDPFGNQMLHIASEGDVFKVWSVGPSGRDSGKEPNYSISGAQPGELVQGAEDRSHFPENPNNLIGHLGFRIKPDPSGALLAEKWLDA